MERVLFVCVHNSARSQMAEAYLRKYGEKRFVVESAGLEPGTINPLVVAVMKEEGIDLSGMQTNSGLHWPFDDPSKAMRTQEEKLSQVRRVRDEIRRQVLLFLQSTG